MGCGGCARIHHFLQAKSFLSFLLGPKAVKESLRYMVGTQGLHLSF